MKCCQRIHHCLVFSLLSECKNNDLLFSSPMRLCHRRYEAGEDMFTCDVDVPTATKFLFYNVVV